MPTMKPIAAQQASAATRGQAGANCQSSSTVGQRHEARSCRGNGPASRVITRAAAVSSVAATLA